MFLFKVEDSFIVPERGLILVPGLGEKKAAIGDKVKIVRPDRSTIETTIRGISFNEHRDILVGPNLPKEDVPNGSEVWLDDEHT
jgi:hypothetical protein